MTTFDTGREAEQAAAKYLLHQGFSILEQNWRTRYCEIDIVAQKEQRVCFVEVKYRKHAMQGDGLEYITDKKLAQMGFAAESWVHSHAWAGEYSLAAIAVTGTDFSVTDYIDL